MHVQYKSVFLKKNFLKQRKIIHRFFINSFSNTPRRKWEIHMDWENDV